jgi:hypothetical protein
VFQQVYTLEQVKEFMKLSRDEAQELPLWDIIRANWASTVECQDKAYLISSNPLFEGSRSWVLNTPTTVDRVLCGFATPRSSDHCCRFMRS